MTGDADTGACGTSTGYRRHTRGKTPACRPCKDAQAAWQREYRKRMYLNRGHLMIDATGTRRRLQALARLGWSYQAIGAEFGVTGARVGYITQAGKVRLDTARKVVELYDRWSMKVGPSNHARGRAIAHGWPPPLDWEGRNIDDPRALSHSQHGALVRAGRKRAKGLAA